MRRDVAPDRYDAVAVMLHWAMAIAVLAMIVIGVVMKHVIVGPGRLFALYQLHKSVGVTILLVAVLRLGWRFTHRPPTVPDAMSGLKRVAAVVVHGLLYVALFALPLSGWVLVSVSPLHIPTVLFGVLPWPHLPILSGIADKPKAAGAIALFHAWAAYLLALLIAGHAAAALRHHFVEGDATLLRMLPRRRTRLP